MKRNKLKEQLKEYDITFYDKHNPKKGSSESNEQIRLMQEIRRINNNGKYKDIFIYAIPNGGSRHPAEAVKMKREGIMSGVPDLHVPMASNSYSSLYIEMKYKYNMPGHDQIEVMKTLSALGNKCVVCYGWQDALEAINDYFS